MTNLEMHGAFLGPSTLCEGTCMNGVNGVASLRSIVRFSTPTTQEKSYTAIRTHLGRFVAPVKSLDMCHGCYFWQCHIYTHIIPPRRENYKLTADNNVMAIILEIPASLLSNVSATPKAVARRRLHSRFRRCLHRMRLRSRFH